MISIAQDVQGPEVVRPWIERSGVSFTALVDQHNVVGKAYDVKFVPVGILLDEEGLLVRPVGAVDIGDELFASQLVEWVENDTIPSAWQQSAPPRRPKGLSPDEAEADALFQRAGVLLQENRRVEAIAALKQAFQLDPENWLIRKQLWAVETPSAFYDGPVDYGWQKDQMKKEAAELAP